MRVVLFILLSVLCSNFALALTPLRPLESGSSHIAGESFQLLYGSRHRLNFTENRGQWDAQVKFRADAGLSVLWFDQDGAVYQFNRSKLPDNSSFTPTDSPPSFETLTIRSTLIGCNPNGPIVGLDCSDYKCNYFLGNDPKEWRTDVPNYAAILYENIYDGIDLKYYGNQKEMEYDFILSPGANPSQIAIHYEGVESLSVNHLGELVVATEWGEVIERRPVVYQLDNKRRIPIETSYELLGNNMFGFSIDQPYEPALALVIDPVLSYSSYLGGGEDDRPDDIAIDDSGCVYVTGYTNSTAFPIVGQLQTDQINIDAFVTKVSNTGNALVYSTYLGGGFYDYGTGIAVDSGGRAYIAGQTSSTDFPVLNPLQAGNAGSSDAYLVKLSALGNSLIYATYLGGSSPDGVNDIDIDNKGFPHLVGFTSSTDFPILNELQSSFAGSYDVWVAKFDSSGASLAYSTYFGGTGSERGNAIAVDALGNSLITGFTQSADFPLVNPLQPTPGDIQDMFLAKISGVGDSVLFSTYLGGTSPDEGMDIGVDGNDNVYVGGSTQSSDFPTHNGYLNVHPGGFLTPIVAKVDPAGNGIVYSTYVGGSGMDATRGISVEEQGSVFITGYAQSVDFPMVNAYQSTLVGVQDGFLARLNPLGDGLIFSTYFGGPGGEQIMAVAADGNGSSFVAGFAIDSIPLLNEFQSFAGYVDVFVAKFTEPPDSDGDGAYDSNDNCVSVANPSQDDADLDGVGDACDICPAGDDNIDTDSDGTPDACDLCPGQDDNIDFDGDGTPDGCDPDDDNDGVPDIDDASPFDQFSCRDLDADGCDDCSSGVDNAANDGADFDGDSLCDLGDLDDDNDGILDTEDTEPLNESVCGDSDNDGCDDCSSTSFDPNNDGLDTDSDGICDLADNCIDVVNPDQVDSDGNGIGDLCQSCCGQFTGGVTGNTDCDSEGKRNLADITRLIDFVYISKLELCCPENGNVDGDVEAKTNLADITKLIDHVYISKAETAACD